METDTRDDVVNAGPVMANALSRKTVQLLVALLTSVVDRGVAVSSSSQTVQFVTVRGNKDQ